MSRGRHSGVMNLTELRGERLVGAHARIQRRRQVLTAVLGVLLLAGSGGIYWALRPGKAQDSHRPVKVSCLACKAESEVRVPLGQRFPMNCPQCGEMTATEIWWCVDCQKEFVPQARQSIIQCARCGGARVGATPARER